MRSIWVPLAVPYQPHPTFAALAGEFFLLPGWERGALTPRNHAEYKQASAPAIPRATKKGRSTCRPAFHNCDLLLFGRRLACRARLCLLANHFRSLAIEICP